jgi:hypothetical protein
MPVSSCGDNNILSFVKDILFAHSVVKPQRIAHEKSPAGEAGL